MVVAARSLLLVCRCPAALTTPADTRCPCPPACTFPHPPTAQPTFGYEGDPMRLLFSRSASPHHGFAAYYTFLEKIFKADAVLHFGTHGSLEFMPGKQVGAAGWM